jgi:hypothetical protein
MDRLTVFGLLAVTAMLVCYALERRSRWFVLAFAGSCLLASAYGFLQGAWPSWKRSGPASRRADGGVGAQTKQANSRSSRLISCNLSRMADLYNFFMASL